MHVDGFATTPNILSASGIQRHGLSDPGRSALRQGLGGVNQKYVQLVAK